jgi:hypothetical protein
MLRKIMAALFCAVLVSSLQAQTDVPTATSRADEVRYAKAAEADALTPLAAQQRAAAMKFAEDDHETHVLLCMQVFQQLNSNHSANAHEISLQFMTSAAAFLYEHPEAATDSVAQNVAGLDAAANVYKSFLAANPKTHFKFLDNVLKQQASGSLKDFVTHTCK